MDIPDWCVWVPLAIGVLLVGIIAICCWELVWWCVERLS